LWNYGPCCSRCSKHVKSFLVRPDCHLCGGGTHRNGLFVCEDYPSRDAAEPSKGGSMKLSLRLLLILGVAITLVTSVAAQNQVRSEKRGLRSDLEWRAETLSESLQKTV